MATAREIGLLILRAYQRYSSVHTLNDDNLLDYIEYIQSTLSHPKEKSRAKFQIKPELKIETEVGVEALLEITQGELRIGIAGSNSLGDWVLNLIHLKDSLLSHIGLHKSDRSYRVGYESLSGHILKYLLFYNNLADRKLVEPIQSISIGGHSAGGRVADYLASSLALAYRYTIEKQLPIKVYSFGSPIFKEFFSPQELVNNNIELHRYAIANDPVAMLPAKLFNEPQNFVEILPEVSVWKTSPHALTSYLNFTVKK